MMRRAIALRLLVFLILVAVGFIVFIQSNDKPATTIVDAAPTTISTSDWQTIFQEDWRISLPNLSWVQEDVSDPDIKLFMRDEPDQKWTVMLFKHQTDEEYSEYVIVALRDFSNNEAKILSISQVVISEQPFTMAEITKHDEMIWVWFTVKESFGYDLYCGGALGKDTDVERDTCEAIANSLHIN